MDQRFVAAGAFAALVTLFTIFSLRRLAHRFGLVDRPDERKWHRGRVPVIGGLAFLLGTIVGLAYFDSLDRFQVCLLATGALIFLVGLIDDMEEISVRTRLLVQAATAGMVIASSGIYVDQLGHLFGMDVRLHALGIPLTIIAVVGLVNAFNMLDGIDGLAGSMALVSILFTLSFASAGWPTPGVALLLQILSVSLIPYLLVNLGWPDGRKIFMGDAGSMFIGFLLAWSLISLSHRSVARIAPVDVLWCIAVPVMDTVAVMVRRISSGCSPFHCDRRHIHHLLIDSGFSARETLGLIVSAGILLGTSGYALRRLPETVSLVAFLVLLVLYVWRLPRLLERLGANRPAARAPVGHPLRAASTAGHAAHADQVAGAAAAGTAPQHAAAAAAHPAPPVPAPAAGSITMPVSAPQARAAPAPARLKALCVLGASSGDIALAPVLQQLSRDARFEARVCVTAQSPRTMQMLQLFGIQPDLDLDLDPGIDVATADPAGLASAALARMSRVLNEFQPDVVLIHGDAPVMLATAMAARYEQVPLARVDTWMPFEKHFARRMDDPGRRLISTLASLRSASAQRSGRILVSAGIPEERITVTGNFAVDTLRTSVEMIERDGALRHDLAQRFAFLRAGFALLLVVNQAPCDTNRELVDSALRQLASQRPALDIVYPADAVPADAEAAARRPLDPPNLHRVEPLDYVAFAYLLDAAYLVLTNSEEIRAEAAILDKPAIVVRDTGASASPDPAPWIVGDESQIVERVIALLTDERAYAAMRDTTGADDVDGMEACPPFVDALANLTHRAASLAA
jgi:undecaprenyl-phosphate alpha-N-acetylglucosaminyl 1-phosphatetransferase/UDP-N-acetylglucosamine 2-epimerase